MDLLSNTTSGLCCLRNYEVPKALLVHSVHSIISKSRARGSFGGRQLQRSTVLVHDTQQQITW